MKRFKYLHYLNLSGYLITIAFCLIFIIELFINQAFDLNGGPYFFFLCGCAYFFLGVLQVFLSLLLLTQWRKLDADCKKLLKIYFYSIITYGIAYFLTLAFVSVFIFYVFLLALAIATYFVAVTYMAKQMKVTEG